MFSSVPVATHASEQLEEESSGERRRRFPLLPWGDGARFCKKAWHTAGGSCPGVPRWTWQSEQRAPQGRCSRLALRVLPPTTEHVVLTEEWREGEAPRGCLGHKFTAINSCRSFSPTPIYHQHRTKYDGHFLSSVWVHGEGSRDKTQVHLKYQLRLKLGPDVSFDSIV